MTDDERFDGLYINVANQTRGIEPLLDTVFSFLRRKSDFFAGPPGSPDGTQAAIQKVNEVLEKHAKIYLDDERKKQDKKKKKEKAKAATKPKAQPTPKPAKSTTTNVTPEQPSSGQEQVLELGEGGFDASAEALTNPPVVLDANDTKTSPAEFVEPTTSKPTTEKESANDDNDQDDGEKKNAPIGNGGTVENKYVWTQTLEELNVTIPLPDNTRGRDLNVVIAKKHFKVGLKANKNGSWIINAHLHKSIICDDSFWTVEDAKFLVVNMQKLTKMEWWEGVCVGDEYPTIDVKTIQPESSKLNDLDGETRQTVEKMMFDQRQKSMGLPSSDEQQKWEMMEKFKKSHPEMDFSNAKMS